MGSSTVPETIVAQLVRGGGVRQRWGIPAAGRAETEKGEES